MAETLSVRMRLYATDSHSRLAHGRRLSVLPLVAVSLWALPCAAHHSAAMFDMTRSITLHGTVRLFQWTNPHCWIQLLVPAPGVPDLKAASRRMEWSVEMGSPTQLYRNGWRAQTLRPGDQGTVVIHPAKDTPLAGEFLSASGANGAPIGPRAAAPPT